ncbi:MAG: DUF5329 family protein [Planctomycetota bacterium]
MVTHAAARLVVLSMLGSAAFAQVSVDVVDLPATLELPIAPGHNRILEVVVHGSPREVWLARSETSESRALLEKGDGERWRINLASRDVERALVAGTSPDDAQEFRVFAADSHGRVGHSVALTYGIARRALDTLRLRVLDGEQHLLASASGWSGRGLWVDPQDVALLEVSADDAPQATAAPWRGSFARSAPGRWSLLVDDALRTAWRDAGRLCVEFSAGRGELVELRVRPNGLDLGKPIVVTVKQRECAPVSGSNGYLRLSIDDVTGGQVLVELRTVEGATLVERRSMTTGTMARFPLGDHQYVLTLDKLVNLLIGDDFAVFTVTSEAKVGPRVEDLLGWIADAPLKFVRNGVEYDGRTAASHLRQKYQFAGAEVLGVDDFIEKVASGSATTSLPYLVRLPDGSEQPLREWLRARIGVESRAKR